MCRMGGRQANYSLVGWEAVEHIWWGLAVDGAGKNVRGGGGGGGNSLVLWEAN